MLLAAQGAHEGGEGVVAEGELGELGEVEERVVELSHLVACGDRRGGRRQQREGEEGAESGL